MRKPLILVAAALVAASMAGISTSSATTARHLLVGARSADTTFASMNSTIGPVRVTRAFYPGTLPAKFSQGAVPAGVKIIVSYKTPSANTALYVKSIPAGVNVEIAFHHEPEADYGTVASVAGATFVKAFNAEAKTIHAANRAMRVAFIGGGYQYRTGGLGIGGYFIPPSADDFYLDSYQRTTIVPAQQDSHVQNFLKELAKRGHHFNGFTEYGRGVTPAGATPSSTQAAARAAVIKTDNAYLRSLPTVDVWAYWYTTDLASGDQWRFTDAASVKAWRAAANG